MKETRFCLVTDGIIENIIVCDAAFAETLGALPAYDGAQIGAVYAFQEDLSEAKADKLGALSAVCNQTITDGCMVTLSDGTSGHLSMTDEDQINLMSALSAVSQGQEGYPYHLDGDLCRVYSAADIALMATAATQHKLYHTTYCNHLNVWVRRCETAEELERIFYGANLPDDLAANMQEVLSFGA